MKPLVIFGLWAMLGWDVGAYAEAFAGIPTAVGIVTGVVIGAALAVEARRRIVVAALRGRQAAIAASPFETEAPLDRAA
jgi:hypothetical protein